MRTRCLYPVVAFLALTLAACGGGPVRRISPPAVSIQQLSIAADGRWHVTLRIQNFSTVPTQFSAIHAKLEVAGVDAGTIDVKPDIDITEDSADIVETSIAALTMLPTTGDFAYRIKGTIDSSEPKGHYPINYSSRLSPVPGIPNTWR